MTCTFFGHRDAPQQIQPNLEKILVSLIENNQVNVFYVGNQGNFDSMVRKTLKSLKSVYPFITYFVVLAYMPGENNHFGYNYYSDTIYPDGLENTPPKFAISKRNNWMINKSDYVVTYVKHNFGGASKFKEIAKKKGKQIINLYPTCLVHKSL